MRNVRLATCILLLLAFSGSSLLASGFESTGLGTTARGMGGAFRAIADDWTAAYYNPAGYAFITGDQLGANLAVFNNRDEITGNYVGRDAYGNTYEWGIVNNQPVYNFHKVLTTPSAGLVTRMPVWGETVFGLSAYQPFDCNIAWRFYDPEATGFRAYNDSSAALIPSNNYKSDLDVVAFQLTASRACRNNTMSFGIGLQVLRADLVFNDLTLRSNPREYPINQRPRDRVPEFSQNEGMGWGFGLRGGFLWKLNEKCNLGVTASLPFAITVDGFTYQTFIMPLEKNLIDDVNLTAEDLLFVKGGSVNTRSDMTTKLKLPPSMALGLSYKVTEKLTMALDAEYTLWSNYDGLEFTYSNFRSLPQKPENVDGRVVYVNMEEAFFTSNLNNPADWKNAGKVMLGARYQYSPFLTLIGGMSADQSPSRNSIQVTPQFMDTGDKYGFNGGAQFHINQWDLGIITSYFSYDDRIVPDLMDLDGDDKFDNFPGVYKASYYETVLSLGYRF
jgi:long-chain fatty acid transport protein